MNTCTTLALLLFFSFSTFSQDPTHQEFHPDGDGYDDFLEFGRLVAMEGNTMVVSVDSEDGILEVFELDNDSWVLKGKLTLSSPLESAFTNSELSLVDNTVVVSVREHVYIFEKPVLGWQDMTETARLKAVAPSGTEHLQDVEVRGNRIFALSDDTANGIYVFEKEPGASWTDQEQSPKLKLVDDIAYKLPSALAAADNYVVVSANDSAFVFEHAEDGQWFNDGKPVRTLLVQNDSTGDFGDAMTAFGNTILFSAEETYTKTNGSEGTRAVVYTFERLGSSWTDSDIDTARLTDPSGFVERSEVLLLRDTTLFFAEGLEDVIAFRKNGDSWDNAVMMQRITKVVSNARSFGRRLALAGKYLAISQPTYHHFETFGAGAVYIYEFDQDGLQYNEVQMLTIDDGDLPLTYANGDYFGADVVKKGNVLVIGSRGDDRTGTDRGCVYVFEKNDTGEWVKVRVLTASDGMDGAAFGTSVDMEGDVIMVGSPFHDVGRGAVYYYVRNGDSWSAEPTEYKLPAVGLQENDLFGYTVCMTGEAMFVTLLGYENGIVQVYTKNGSWTQPPNFAINLLPWTDPDDIKSFGWDMDVSGNYLIVGQAFNGTPNPRAFLFEKQTDFWADAINIAELRPSDATSYQATGNFTAHYFGVSVAIDDTVAVVGGYRYEIGHSAYVYRKPATGWITAEETLKIDSDHGTDATVPLSVEVDVEDNRIALSVMSRTTDQDTYLFASPDGTWSEAVLETQWSQDYGYYAELTPDDVILCDYYNNKHAGKVMLIPLFEGHISLGESELPEVIDVPFVAEGKTSDPYVLNVANTGVATSVATIELTGNLSSSDPLTLSVPPGDVGTVAFFVVGDELGERTGEVKISSNIPGFEERTIEVNTLVVVGTEPELDPAAIYPNPASTVLNIRVARGKRFTNARLYDHTGRLVFETGEFFFDDTLATVNLPALPSGLYLLHIDGRAVGRVAVRD